MKHIVVLGATGSIGTQTLDVARRLPDHLRVIGLSGYRNEALLKEQAAEFRVPNGSLAWGETADLLKLARLPEADLIVMAVDGAVGTRATLAALEAGKDVALATKQVMVTAGEIVTQAAKKSGAKILPVDSEHSAIFQCLQGSPAATVKTLWITASGGPFRTWTKAQMASANLSDALKHPTWPSMGRSNTLDSATLMNKGLEMIEARWLFGLPMEQIKIVVHPQSIIHSMVEFQDSAVLAQLGLPDMRLPIEYALLYPNRVNADLPRLDILKLGTLTFEPPDEEKFPSLGLARRAAAAGGTVPTVLNAANEAATRLFRAEKIPFGAMMERVAETLDAHQPVVSPTLDEIFTADSWARQRVERST